MPCYRPLRGYRSRDRNPSGKRSIVFNSKEGFGDVRVEVPCGQCIGCRLERSRQWALRCMYESKLYEDNCFLTLTYSDENLPPFSSLRVEDFQKFMKRLRFEFSDRSIRFFHCGEYGERFKRPHYHALLFNFDFADKEYYKTVNGNGYFKSKTLERLWPLGHSMIGAVTFESAAYVARYITKKITGPEAEEHYSVIDPGTGEVVVRKPEYVTMSRRPGIGKGFFEKFKSDFYPSDFVVVERGKKMVRMQPPKFFDAQLAPEELARVQAKRKVGAAKHVDNNTRDRLEVREIIQYQRAKELRRSYESDQ